MNENNVDVISQIIAMVNLIKAERTPTPSSMICADDFMRQMLNEQIMTTYEKVPWKLKK